VHDDEQEEQDKDNTSLIASETGSRAIFRSELEEDPGSGSRKPSGHSATVLQLHTVGSRGGTGYCDPLKKFKIIGFAATSTIFLLGGVLPMGVAVYLRTIDNVVGVPSAVDIPASDIKPPASNASTTHVLGHASSCENSPTANGSFLSVVDWWLSTEDGGALLANQPPLSWDPLLDNASEGEAVETIMLCNEERYQEILGIGTSLEAATAFNMARLNHTQTEEVLQALFDPERGVGFNLARVTIGTSDFAPLPFYTYDDLSIPTASDEDLDMFSIARDETYILPLITKALNASQNGSGIDSNDSLLLFASPWSPPSWMKSSRRMQGGHLFPWFRRSYARYLVAFVKAYLERGIHIHALTVQNEPLANKRSYPTSLHADWRGGSDSLVGAIPTATT